MLKNASGKNFRDPEFLFFAASNLRSKKTTPTRLQERPKSVFQTRSAYAAIASFNKTKTRVIRGPPAPFVGRKFSKIS
jgi:hypothetical protein